MSGDATGSETEVQCLYVPAPPPLWKRPGMSAAGGRWWARTRTAAPTVVDAAAGGAVHRLGVGAVLDAGLQAGNAGEAGKQDGVRAAGLLVPGAPHTLQGWRQEAQVCEATAAPCWQRPGQRLTRQ
jgi:hypothetical protein